MTAIKKLNRAICMLAFSAGIIFLSCGFAFTLPKGAVVNGVEVGGITRPQAVKLLTEQTVNTLKNKHLIVIADGGQYTFSYPEISFKADFDGALKDIKKGGNYTVEIYVYLCGLDEIAAGICLDEDLPVIEPSAKFSPFGEPFSYDGGRDGKLVDSNRLKSDIINSLNGDFSPVRVCYLNANRKTTLDEVRADTVKLSSFTTYFDGDNIARKSNIRLAAAKLNGAILGGGETLSFNALVGERSEERGFLPAKIIENGEFVEGIGGGVCQVSTTLYNAALLSGLSISEYHPHSLSVGYVPPSRDAMVSGSACDLKIKNTGDKPIYLRAQTDDNSVTVTFFGRSDGATYSLESSIIENLPFEEEEVDDPSKARVGKEGIKSECYLICERDGFISRTKIRGDCYRPIAERRFKAPDTAILPDNSN